MMTHPRAVAITGMLALLVIGTDSGPQPLQAQVIRCYDVVCVTDAQGVVRCIEKPVICPPDVT
jgi:hypothetical protein